MTSSTAPAPGDAATPWPAAVLWDFDGTLVDTEPVWMAAEYALAERLGAGWNEEHCRAMVGNALIDSGRYIVDVIGRDDLTPEWVVEQLIEQVVAVTSTSEIPWRPGVVDLLASLQQAGVPCALVSASYRRLLAAVLDRLPAGTFAVVVAGDEVTHGKPHPEPYLTACERLDVAPADCVVLEDSLPGCASGNAAGAVVVGVRHLIELPPAERRVVIDSLTGLDAAGLARLAAGARPEPPGSPG